MEKLDSELGFSVENLTSQMAEMSYLNVNFPFNGLDSNYIILNFGEKKRGDLVQAELLFDFKGTGMKIDTTSASCGCTVPSFVKHKDEGKYIVRVTFNSNDIRQNISKYVSIYVRVPNEGQKKIRINVRIN